MQRAALTLQMNKTPVPAREHVRAGAPLGFRQCRRDRAIGGGRSATTVTRYISPLWAM